MKKANQGAFLSVMNLTSSMRTGIRHVFWATALLSVLLIGACGNPSKTDTSDVQNNEATTPENSGDNQDVLQEPSYSSGKSHDAKRIDQKEEKPSIEVEIDENSEGYLLQLYQQEHIKWFYGDPGKGWSDTPPLRLSERLSTLESMSYEELRLFRNEIYATKGYLFNDAVLRGYFNQFEWYRPIFKGWEENALVDNFKVVLNEEEHGAITQILAEEQKRKALKLVEKEGLQLHNYDLVVNKAQFASLPLSIEQDLKASNTSIVNAKRAMPFFVYDLNAYDHVPHYITSDLYLFILHKYFSKSLEKIEEGYMAPALSTLLSDISVELETVNELEWEEAKKWLSTYLALASYAGGNTELHPNVDYADSFNEEKKAIDQNDGGPVFIPNSLVQYNQLTPRSHYTQSNELKHYFKCFKWLNINAVVIDENQASFKGMVLMSQLIISNEKLYEDYRKLRTTLQKLAGKEDNVSLDDLITILTENEALGTHSLNAGALAYIQKSLELLNKERIKTVLGEGLSSEDLSERISFFSGTYSLSGEIFSRLVNIDGPEEQRRTFPNGIDLPAVFGNPIANAILTNELRVANTWPGFSTHFKTLQEQFKGFDQWNEAYAFKGVQVALAASQWDNGQPDFMKTDVYQRKQLNTTMASWAHVKHDLVLYQEKPHAAEAGQGGGPKPPTHYSYIEPNLEFWDRALELVEWFETIDKVYSTNPRNLIQLKRIGQKLLYSAYQQETGGGLSNSEMDDLWLIGGEIEHLLMSILESYDHIPEREKSTGIITDVYSYNSVSLLAAVGHMDDMYVLVPIRGEYYMARGTSFSYYEFTGSVTTDETWRARLKKGDLPERPIWYKDYIRNVKTPESVFQYRYVSRPRNL